MPQALELTWNRCRGDQWGELLAVDLSHRHFNDLQGVFVIWHGGTNPATVCVGQGLIRERLNQLRNEAGVLAFKNDGLFVTWAKVERAARDGVERFLFEALQPKLRMAPPGAVPIECNVPGRATDQKAKGGAALLATVSSSAAQEEQPPQIYQDMVFKPGEDARSLKAGQVQIVAPPKPKEVPTAVAAPTPQVRRLTHLQKTFNELVQKALMQPQKQGFFSGGAKPKEDDDTLVVDVVKLIMEEALHMHSSDIHLEPMENYLRVRFRVDGILEEVLEIPKATKLSVVSHIRVRCGLDPEQALNTGKPQDGRMAVVVDRQESDLRLSTFPTPNGDKAVLRIINHNVKVPTLEELGLRPQITELVRQLIHRPQGMIVVTGPAGSGKSTTLYTALQTLNTPQRNIVTLEDPIEQKIPGLAQGALNVKMGFTFAEGLRSILRQDPNVIMVGEVRDKETAEIAMSAALTGHLLFTTLHTTSALGAVTRLLDMGLEPFLISAALTAIFAQRLARRLCLECREAYAPTTAELAQIKEMTSRAGVPLPASLSQQLFRSKGCGKCRETGFAGRVLILEAIPFTTGLRQLVLRKAPLDEMRKQAIQEGTVTMLMDGLDKVTQGLTNMGEIVRVVGAGD